MKKFITVMLLSLFMVQTAGAISAFDIRWGTDLNSNMRSNTLKQWAESIEGRIGGVGTGSSFYVDSNVTTEGDGSSWTDARNTLDEAVALCTEDNGDRIYVAEGHIEDWTVADSADLDVAGITVIGCGQGESRPLFTLDGAAAELVIGDASIMITNLQFRASVDSTVHIIEVEDDADGFIIYNCEFLEPESANTTDEADDIIQVAAGANKGFIVGNTFYSLSAGANTAIDLTAGVIEDITIAYNYFNGAWAEGAIFSDDIDLRARIIGNEVIQLDAAMTPITFNTTASGLMMDNYCVSKSTTYLIDAGSMHCKGNMWSDTDTTDVAAVPMFTSETGVDIWAASQLAQIEAEVVDALETTANLSEIGDKVVADWDANSPASAIIVDLAGISEIGDKVVADMDANSLLVNWTAARSLIVTDLAGISEIGDKVVADMDANSLLVNWTAARAAIVTDLAGISEIGDKVQADMDANSTTFYWAERTAVVVGTNNAISEDLFDVAGGPILITNFVCLVTETIDANVATCQIIIDRDDEATNTEFSTAVAVTDDVLGTLWVFSDANPAVLTPLTPGAVGQSTLMSPWFCAEGMVETIFSAVNLDGSINYYMTYRPLVTGVTVTAQ